MCPENICIPGGSCDEHGATGNLSDLDHLQNDGGGLARLFLAHQALRRLSRLQRIGVYPEAADVRMGGNEVQAPQLLALGNGHHGLLPDITLARAAAGNRYWGIESVTYSRHFDRFSGVGGFGCLK